MYRERELGVRSGLLNGMQGKFRRGLGKKINQNCIRQEIKRILKTEDTEWTQNTYKGQDTNCICNMFVLRIVLYVELIWLRIGAGGGHL
jgi:hypothetical protein